MWGPRLESASLFRASGVFSDIIEKPARGEKVVFPTGSQKYELLYVKDAAHSVVLATYAERLEHRVFNIGCGCVVSIKELVELIKKHIPTAEIEIWGGIDDFTVPLQSPIDISLARSELNYQPKVTPPYAVEDYLKYLEKKAQ